MTFVWYNVNSERKGDKILNRQHGDESMACIWDCLECGCEGCVDYYYDGMEYDETDRKEEFMREWFEYIEDRGE